MRYVISSQYTGKSRRKKMFHLLFLLFLGIALLIAILMLGNLLHDRVEKTNQLMQYAPYSYTPVDTTPAALPAITYRVPEETVSGVFSCVDLSDFSESTDWNAYCADKAEAYDGLSLCVTNGSTPRFAFAVFSERMESDELQVLPDTESLRALTAAAAQNALAVTAVADFPTETKLAGELAAELTTLGCQSVLFVTQADVLSEEKVQQYFAAAESARALAPEVQIGFSVSAAALRDGASALQLDKLADGVDFLALDAVSQPDADSLLALCESVYGSISYYSLRILIAGDEDSVTAQMESLRNAGYPSVLPTS